jgi:hypothetical protein
MANPLQSVAAAAMATDLREWCRENNSRPITRRMDRWYFVAKADGVENVSTLEGSDGHNAWRMIDGTFQDFMGWPASRMSGYRSWLSGCIEKGR